MGCRKNRYCSDMTRTFFCRAADPKYAAIHDLVREANELAESMLRPAYPVRPGQGRTGPHLRRRIRRILHPPAGPLHRPDGA
ncbi:M24 family metallopeptidase [Oscillibacter sp.]|uniref:M24 family metallopeptidase n=1 Tax=Oscillibacter sp. TaxID=1945593 RepID=UPI00338F007F